MDKRPFVKIKTTEQKTQNFYKTVEAGDITLFDIFEEAIAMFGFTKVGKTTTCHILCDNILKAENHNGELVLRSNAQKYRTAKIGATPESETQIPNIFQKFLRDPKTKEMKKLWLLDQPGYGDTYGFHRIFSNGYFHYRTFSKTPKLKFILAINFNDLRGTAQKFKKTISNFINAFASWQTVRPQILKATSFLITKVDAGITAAKLKQILSSLSDSPGGMSNRQYERYRQMITEMITYDKIFMIERPKTVGQCTLTTTILQQIYEKTIFWEREINATNKNIVDMSAINFSVSNEILKELRDSENQLFRIDFEYFMNYMQNRLDMTIQKHDGSLCKIVETLAKDAQGNSQSRHFLQLMQVFIKNNYNYFEQYRDKREKTEANLFKSQELNDSIKYDESVSEQKIMKQVRSVYFIKKFKVLQYIEALNEKNQGENWVGAERTIEELQAMSALFQGLFRKFSILKVEKSDNEKIIYKYSYIIQRLIEEYKIMTLILFKDSKTQEEFHNLKDIKVFSEDIVRAIKDKFFGGVVGEVKVQKLKSVFITNFQFDQLQIVNEEIVSFFQSGFSNDEKIQFKIAQMMISYSNLLFREDKVPTMEQKKFTLEKLSKYREKLYYYWKNLQKQGKKKSSQQICIFTVIKLTQQIAVILKNYNQFASARECYRSINDPQQIFEMYEQQIVSESIKHDRQVRRKLLLEWAKEAITYHRKDLAVKCCQKAYSLSSNYEQIKEAGEAIVQLSIQKKEDENEDTYAKRLQNDNFCSDFPDSLKNQIQTILIL